MTLTHVVTLGDIDSFGDLAFDEFTTESLSYDFEMMQALVARSGSPFPANRYGVSQIPFKMPIIEAVLVMVGAAGSTMIPVMSRDASPHVDVDTKVNMLLSKWQYVDPGTGVAGHTDTLRIWSPNHTSGGGGTKYGCTAFLYKAPVKSQAGTNWRHVKITCTWCMLSPLVAL